VYDTAYIRSYVSVLASQGGVGKTSLQIVEALAICTGRDLLGEPVRERTNCWLINLEDPMEEAQRRIAAAMMHYNVKAEDIEGRLFVDAGRDVQIKFALQGRDGVQTNDEMVQYMSDKIQQHNIGMVFIDPWVGANDINENDNMAMNSAVAAARWVCDKTDCAMVLTHHVRKSNGEDASADSIRGAGSLLSAARAARVVNKVSEEDAMKLGVSEMEARGIFRVDDGKSNLAPPAAKAVYRRMHGVQLPNQEYVGVCVPFKMPDLFDGVTAKHAMLVQRAVGQAEENGDPYRENVRSKRWIGKAVASALELDIDKKSEKARAKAIAEKWIQTGVLKIEQFADKRAGRDVTIVSVGEWITREEAGL
jgi:RecA-family ATPase